MLLNTSGLSSPYPQNLSCTLFDCCVCIPHNLSCISSNWNLSGSAERRIWKRVYQCSYARRKLCSYVISCPSKKIWKECISLLYTYLHSKKRNRERCFSSRAKDREKILSPDKESSLRPSHSALRCSTAELQRLYGERDLYELGNIWTSQDWPRST